MVSQGIELQDTSAGPSGSVVPSGRPGIKDTTKRMNPSTSDQTAENVSTDDPKNPSVKTVRFKLVSCCLCFLVAGLNDGSIGALIPYLIEEYGISTSFVGIAYAGSFAGWLAAALVMPLVMAHVGMRGTLLIGAGLYVLAQILRVWDPPYALFAVSFFFASLGQAFQDAQGNTFVSSIAASHWWLGLIHAMYGLGLLVAPLVATAIASNRPRKWATYYTFPLGLGVLNMLLVLGAFFWPSGVSSTSASEHDGESSSGPRPAATQPEEPSKGKLSQALEVMAETLQVKVVWLIGLFFFFHLGAGITIGGWIVVFLSEARNLPLHTAGYIPTGFYAALFLGRLILPGPTHTWLGGEHHMLTLFSIITLVLQLIAWLVKSAVVTSVMMCMIGFFMAPFFAAGMQVASQVIPRKIRASALGLIFVMAQLGGSIFPALTGLIAAKKGVEVLQPVAVALIAATGLSWWFVPTAPREVTHETSDGV